MRAARNHDGYGLLDRRHDIFGVQPDLGIGTVQDHDPPIARVPQQVKGVHGEPEVLDRWDVQRGDKDQRVTQVQRRKHVLGEGRRRVDDDVVV